YLMQKPLKPLAVAAMSLAMLAPAVAQDTVVLDRPQPACMNERDASTANYYWLNNDPFLARVMSNHKDTCFWLKTGSKYTVRETKKEGWMIYSCLSSEDESKPCLWLARDERHQPALPTQTADDRKALYGLAG